MTADFPSLLAEIDIERILELIRPQLEPPVCIVGFCHVPIHIVLSEREDRLLAALSRLEYAGPVLTVLDADSSSRGEPISARDKLLAEIVRNVKEIVLVDKGDRHKKRDAKRFDLSTTHHSMPKRPQALPSGMNKKRINYHAPRGK